jgi:glycosyltransferase involved in cell wall biosynthesis
MRSSTWARREPVRKRRLAHEGDARSSLAACAAPRPVDPRRPRYAHANGRTRAPCRIYHGRSEDLLTPQTRKEPKYLAFLGRICSEKRTDLAIEIAAQSGLPLKIAAKIDKADQEYFKNTITPLLSRANVEFLGEINEQQKPEFLSGAQALRFPIEWSKPFGLVMIDAMECGTPVIAFNRDSVPEVIDHGVTGYSYCSGRFS